MKRIAMTVVVFAGMVLCGTAFAVTTDCTKSAQCVDLPPAYCDGEVAVSYVIGVCNDSDHDGTPDACSFPVVRTKCKDGATYCYEGECLTVGKRVRQPKVPKACKDVDPTESECDVQVGDNYYFTTGRSGGCVEKSEKFTCNPTTICQIVGKVATCVPKGPQVMVDNKPDEVGKKGGIPLSQWKKMARIFAPVAHVATEGFLTCNQSYGGGSATDAYYNALCGRLAECFSAEDDEKLRRWAEAWLFINGR